MKYFEGSGEKGSHRGTFAAELARMAGAEHVHMGFFDCDAHRFIDTWSGTAQAVQIVYSDPCSDSALTDAITGLLRDAQAGGSTQSFAISRLRSADYVIGIGTELHGKVPVVTLHGGLSDNETSQDSCLQLGLAYAAQLLDEQDDIQSPVSVNEAIETALDVLSINLAVVDAYGQIEYSTNFSREWLEQYGGFEINLHRLSGKTQKLQKVFHQALALATGPDPQPSTVPVNLDKRVTRLAVVLPLEQSNPPRAVVILEQGDKDPELGRHLLKLSGLTNSECRIAYHLLEGKSLNEIAAETDLSLSTVRSYLKAIFAKTSTHRQGQFITYFHNTVPRVKYIPAIGEQRQKPSR